MYDRNVELWREIPGYPGNEASTFGKVRTYWYKVRNKVGRGCHRERWDTPRPLNGTPKEDGHLHTNIYCEPKGKRDTRTIHTLIANTFIPKPDDCDTVDYTVDHIRSGPEGKLDNSVWNLQWLSRGNNVRKAYQDGMHDDRIRERWKPIVAIDEWTGDEIYFDSIKEASNELMIEYSAIAHVLRGKTKRTGHYRFEYAGGEERLLFGDEDDKLLSWIRAGLR